MFKALLYKEWIKLKNIWLLVLAAHVLFALYTSLRLYTNFRLNDAATLWSGWVFNGDLFFSSYAYLPTLTGILLAGAQFLPEVQEKRVRLVLHLPMGENLSLSLHLLSGIILYAVAILPALILFMVGSIIYFPAEYLLTAFSTAWPWLLAGLASYFLFAAMLMEMLWRYRVVYFLLFLGIIEAYFLNSFYGAYRDWRLVLPIVTFSLACLPLLAAYRFRKGLTL